VNRFSLYSSTIVVPQNRYTFSEPKFRRVSSVHFCRANLSMKSQLLRAQMLFFRARVSISHGRFNQRSGQSVLAFYLCFTHVLLAFYSCLVVFYCKLFWKNRNAASKNTHGTQWSKTAAWLTIFNFDTKRLQTELCVSGASQFIDSLQRGWYTMDYFMKHKVSPTEFFKHGKVASVKSALWIEKNKQKIACSVI